jgi:hypothetical protein
MFPKPVAVVMRLRYAIEVAGVAEGKAAEPALIPLPEEGRIAVERVRWPRSFGRNFRVAKWIVGRGLSCVRSGRGSK